VPTTFVIVRIGDAESRFPACSAHCTVVKDDQDVVKHIVVSMRAEGELSLVLKLRPEIVTACELVLAVLTGKTELRAGESKVKPYVLVPTIVSIVAVTIFHADEPGLVPTLLSLTVQSIAVDEDHAVVWQWTSSM
jgi:hypothetical protein